MAAYKWTTQNGHKVEIVATCTRTLIDHVVDLDGDRCVSGKETRVDASLVMTLDGKKVGDCWNPTFWRMIDTGKKDGTQRIWGIEGFAFDAERAAAIDAFLKSVIAEGTAPEIIASENAAKEADRATEINAAIQILGHAKTTPLRNADGTLMNKAQATEWKRRYNQAMNEGGEGFVPEPITVEQVAWANTVLASNGPEET